MGATVNARSISRIAVICVSVAAVAVAGIAPDAFAGGRSSSFALADTTADLDGDGHIDLVRLAWYETGHGYGLDRVVIDVDGVLYAARGEAMIPRLILVDIASDDGRLEIAVLENGPSDDYATHFFRFAEHRIQAIGTLPGHIAGPPAADGSGVITARCRGSLLETWWYPCKFSEDRYRPQFAAILERYHVMDTAVTLKVDLPLVQAPWDSTAAGVISAGETAHLRRTDDQNWCEIESLTGLRGWFAVVGHSFIPTVGKSATEVFDGLRIAD